MDFHYPEIQKKDFINEDKCCTSGLHILQYMQLTLVGYRF